MYVVSSKTSRPFPPSGSCCKRRTPESPTQLPRFVTVHTIRESPAVPVPVGSAFRAPRPEEGATTPPAAGDPLMN